MHVRSRLLAPLAFGLGTFVASIAQGTPDPARTSTA